MDKAYMTQEVNFLNTISVEKELHFPAQLILKLLIIYAFLLLLISSLVWVNNLEKRNELIGLGFKKNVLNEQIKLIDNRQKRGQISLRLTGMEKIPFSRYMTVLGSSTPKNIWFNQMVFDLQKKQILLSGETLSQKFLPDFILALSRYEIFSEGNFNTLNLNKKAEKAGSSFTISYKTTGTDAQ